MFFCSFCVVAGAVAEKQHQPTHSKQKQTKKQKKPTGQVIKGWDLGVAAMRKGETAVLTCAAPYAYGDAGSPPKIPGGATLQFEVELLSWQSVKDIAGDGGVIKTVLEEGSGWQTPGEGEALIAAMLDIPLEERTAGFAALGIPEHSSAELAAAADAVMGECVLALYRSATQPAMAEWGADAHQATARPGLFLHATDDPYAGKGRGVLDTAETMGAQVVELEGRGHWWMLEDPEGGAAVLDAWIAGQ